MTRRDDMMVPKLRGFTLIELLLVVSIVSILSAIALINMAEAQVRAKIARAKSDMRSITTGLESYAVDHNEYPPNPDVRGRGGSGTLGFNIAPFGITTPVAYLSSLPVDPFKLGTWNVYGTAQPSGAAGIVTYDYYKIIGIDEWWGLRATGVQTSLIAVHSPMPLPEETPSPLEFANRGAFDKYGAWLQWSIGPDRVPWRDEIDFRRVGDLGSLLNPAPLPPNGYTFDVPFDPTNGTSSFGNIIRTTYGDVRLASGVTGTPPPPGGGPDRPPDNPPPNNPPGNPPGNPPANPPANPPGGGQPPPGGNAPGAPGGAASAPGTAGVVTGKNSTGAVTGSSDNRTGRRLTPTPGGSYTPGPTVTPSPTPAAVIPTAVAEFVKAQIAAAPPPIAPVRPPQPMSTPELMRVAALGLFIAGLLLMLLYAVVRRARKKQEASEFDASDVSDNTIGYIPDLAERVDLNLSHSRVTDAGIAKLRNLSKLESLNLSQTAVTGAGFAALNGNTSIKELILMDAPIMTTELAQFKGLKGLETLVLAGAPLTNSALKYLKDLTSLKSLNLRHTQIDQQGVDWLQKALPKCDILHSAYTEPPTQPEIA